MKRESVPICAAAGILVLVLAGCSAPAGLRALDRDDSPQDALPAIVNVPADVNRNSSRLLATRDGVQFFALQSDDARTTCLATVSPGTVPDWHVGCGLTTRSGEIIKMASRNGSLSTILLGDDSDTGKLEPGWSKIADNILVAD